MEKITYWLKKLGILRAGTYSAKGDAKKLTEMNVDSELYQSDGDIEKENIQKNDIGYEEQKNKNKKISKIVFWIFVAIAVFFFLAFWGSGWSFWTFLGIIVWGVFLRWLWVHVTSGFFAIGKILVLGCVVIVLSFIFVDPEESADVSVEKKMEVTEKSEGNDMYLVDGVEDDHIVQFLLTLKKDTGINFSKIQNDEVVWTGGPGLQLQKAKSFGVEELTPKDFDKIQKFFLDLGANNGGLGFEFVPPAGTQSSGFALTDEENTGMMCVLIGVDNEGVMVGCGWGPTGNPRAK